MTQGAPEAEGLLTPRQAAALVGVSESTVRRWCDDDLVATARTAGGHRRIVPAALVSFARSAGFMPQRALAPSVRGGRNAPSAEVSERFFQALTGEGAVELRAIVSAWVARGRPVGALFDDVVAPAMIRIGDAWAEGRLAVHDEHRATVRVGHALSTLEAWLPPPPPDAPVAVCAALTGDPYGLGPSMAGWVVGAEGWRADVLGADTPAAEIVKAADLARAGMICVSIGAAPDVASLRREVAALWAWCERAGAALVIGGRARDAARGRPLPDEVFGTSMTELAHRARHRAAELMSGGASNRARRGRKR